MEPGLGPGLGLSVLFVGESHGCVRTRSDGTRTPLGGSARRSSIRQMFVFTSLRESRAVGVQPGGAREQPQQRDGVWSVPAAVRPGGLSVANIGIFPGLYPAVGCGSALHGGLVGSSRPQVVDRRRDVAARRGDCIDRRDIRLRRMGPRLGATRNWYGDGLPGPSRRDQDVAHPIWRASSVGIYRFWRDAGFAIGAILAGVVADALGLTANVWAVAALTAISGLVVAIRMYETLPKPPGQFRKGPPERSAGPRAGTAAFTNEDRVQAHRATQRGGPAPPPVRVRLARRRVRIKSRDHSCGDVVVRPCS
jgi:hypothetical protein